MNPKEILNKLEKNLESIASQRDSLKSVCQEKDLKIEKLMVTISGLEDRLTSTLEEHKKHSISIQTPENNNGVKLKIDGLIQEIDECLALLNN